MLGNCTCHKLEEFGSCYLEGVSILPHLLTAVVAAAIVVVAVVIATAMALVGAGVGGLGHVDETVEELVRVRGEGGARVVGDSSEKVGEYLEKSVGVVRVSERQLVEGAQKPQLLLYEAIIDGFLKLFCLIGKGPLQLQVSNELGAEKEAEELWGGGW